MILGYTADQIRAAEKPLLDQGEPLMQRAAAALADEIRSLLARRGSSPGTVLVLAGSGDNGGDALYAAASLASTGVDVRVVTTGSRVHEAALEAAAAAGADTSRREAAVGSREFAALVDGVDLVVDGILGIGSGSSPALRGRSRTVVEALLPSVLGRIAEAPGVVAVDLPSGVGSDDGSVPDPCVLPAEMTVTFGAVKAGLLLSPASGLVGRIRLVDLGLGPGLEGVEPRVSVDGTP